jgi:hypothetical protein
MLVEADPDGGVLAARFAGLRADTTLVDVAATGRRSLDDHALQIATQRLWSAVDVVVAPPSADESASALRAMSESLAPALRNATGVAVADVGRLNPSGPSAPIVRRADLVLLVCAPTFEQVAVAQSCVIEFGRTGCPIEIVCVGTGEYGPADVASALQLPLAAVLPWDARVAAGLVGEPTRDRRVRQSQLWRALVELARAVTPVQPLPSSSASRSLPLGEAS